MPWETVRGKMSQGLGLNIPQMDYFEKSPAHTPGQVLNSLDLLSVDDGKFFKTDSGDSSTYATPVARRRFKTQFSEIAQRRQSLKSDVFYDESISDEFSYINLTIKERRPSTGFQLNDQTPHFNNEPVSSKRVVFTKNISNDNQIVIAKVLADDGEEDQIEIIDLDDDEEHHSPKSFPTPPLPQDLYPNCDVKVWLRSCEQEIINPIEGVVSGEIPSWINGSLLRNGPGSIKVGDMEYNHLFDAAALLHRFDIAAGNVTYQCRFLRSDTYKKNLAANRIVVSEFGTSCVPDPCQSIFERCVRKLFFVHE